MVYRNGQGLQQQGLPKCDKAPWRGKRQALLTAVLLSFSAPHAEAGLPPQNDVLDVATVQVSKQVLPPLAHVRFCMNYPEQCTPRSGVSRLGRSMEEQLVELADVNIGVNMEITPQEDGRSGGLKDEWSLDVARGDCEDYALLKQKRLISKGWPSGKLRIATALMQDGTGHAVLIARLSNQDVVLDNLTTAIRPWHETEYKFLKIQSDTDPNAWFEVQNPEALAKQIS